MKKRATIRTILALIVVTLVCWLAYGRSHPPKARAQHHYGVNTVRSVSITLSDTSAPPVLK